MATGIGAGTATGRVASLGGSGVGIGRLNLLDVASICWAHAGRREVHAVGIWGTVGAPTVGSAKGGRDGSGMIISGQSNDN